MAEGKTEVPGMCETQTSSNKKSSREIGFIIRMSHVSPKMGQDQVSEWVSVSIGMPHPLQMFYGNREIR